MPPLTSLKETNTSRVDPSFLPINTGDQGIKVTSSNVSIHLFHIKQTKTKSKHQQWVFGMKPCFWPSQMGRRWGGEYQMGLDTLSPWDSWRRGSQGPCSPNSPVLPGGGRAAPAEFESHRRNSLSE